MASQTEGQTPSILLSFTAANARSYRDEVTLSMLGTRLSAEGVPRSLIPAGMRKPVRVLPSAGIFGANASGKTTILKAMDDMRRLVITSFRDGSRGSGIERHHFLIDPTYSDRPTRYEVDLLLEGVRWVYGFEIDGERVHEEYAYHWPRGRQALIFNREGTGVSFGLPFRASDRQVEKLVRDNALLLSAAGAVDSGPLSRLFRWFQSNLALLESSYRTEMALHTAEMAQSSGYRDKLMGLLKSADLGITGFEIRHIDLIPLLDEVPEGFVTAAEHLREAVRLLQEVQPDVDHSDGQAHSLRELVFTHLGTHGGVTLRAEDESRGTMVWLSLIGPIVRAMQHGGVILIDELDASLHPDLVERVITMFQDPQLNRHHAQLLFNSHDGAILEARGEWPLGRDQIWFTEKYSDGSTRLYPLDDFSPRKDDDIRGRYFRGRYGGLPVVGDSAIRKALNPLDQ